MRNAFCSSPLASPNLEIYIYLVEERIRHDASLTSWVPQDEQLGYWSRHLYYILSLPNFLYFWLTLAFHFVTYTLILVATGKHHANGGTYMMLVELKGPKSDPLYSCNQVQQLWPSCEWWDGSSCMFSRSLVLTANFRFLLITTALFFFSSFVLMGSWSVLAYL